MISIPGYRDLDCIHESVSSQIFRARREQDELPVILKLLREDYPSAQELIRYRQEYKITSLLSGRPGIIQTLGTGEQGSTFFIVLEDFGADSLNHWIGSRRFTLVEKLSLAVRLAGSIGEVHAAHIIHKDINLGNMVYHPDSDTLKLIDFGISTQLTRECPEIQSPNVLEGTLAYISPEQTGRMNRAIDYRTDFYSLGAALYQLFTGWLPFESDDPMELVHCHLARSPALPHRLSPEIPEMVSAILMKLMAKMPEDRYQSAAGIQTDLQKCVQQLQKKGRVQFFTLGQLDIPEQLLIPQRLYGRESELSKLLGIFDRVAAGGKELTLVAGHSGIGKTVLVQELYKPITERRGYFVSGKFDQLKRDTPYRALSEAFNQLMRQLLTLPEEQLGQWQRSIREALGPNGKVVAEVIPDLELVIGLQPEVEEAGPQERQNRFNYVFQNFVQAVADPAHPLILFVDDLQWVDSASLKLLKLIMTTPDIQHLHLIAAFRDNEVSPSHPWIMAVNELEAGGCRTESIALGPLDVPCVNQLLSDTLRSEPGETQELAELVHGKTQGNPFFVAAFLQTLDRNGILTLDRETGAWHWNLRQIRGLCITDNVAELMVESLRRLDPQTQTALSLAACIGNRFELSTLAVVCESNLKQTLSLLHPAMAEGFVLPQGQEYKAIEHDVLLSSGFANVGLVFAHDRIQQAAYSLITEDRRKVVHWKIGKLLQKIGGDPIDIANHLNVSVSTLTVSEEREDLARLNLLAGKKAKSAAAYAQAAVFLDNARRLVGPGGWGQQPDLTREIYEEGAEAALLTTDLERMWELSAKVLEESRAPADCHKTYNLRILGHIAQHNPRLATREALSYLRSLGISLPERPGKFRALLALLSIKAMISQGTVQRLPQLPRMTDPSLIAAMQILITVASAAYTTNPTLLVLLNRQRLSMTLKQGNSAWSVSTFSGASVLFAGVLSDLETAYQMGKVAQQLIDQFDAGAQRCRTNFMFYTFTAHCKESVRSTLRPLLDNYQTGRESGDFEFAAFSLHVFCQHGYFVGLELAHFDKDLLAQTEAIQRLKQEKLVTYNQIFHQAILNLLGRSQEPCALRGELIDEDKSVLDLEDKGDGSALHGIFFLKLHLCCLFQRWQEAAVQSDKARKWLAAVRGNFMFTRFFLYDSIAWLNVYERSSAPAKRAIRRRVRANQRFLKKRASHAPVNHEHAFLLVEAERQRVLGHHVSAARFYRRAIELAHETESPNDAGLANELAGGFYLARKEEETAVSYLLEAKSCYLKWGAKAKLCQMEEVYGALLTKQREVTPIRTTSTVTLDSRSKPITRTTTNVQMISLDLGSAIKASQTISGEIELSRLLETLMKIMQENAGAERVCLVLKSDEGFVVEAMLEGSGEQRYRPLSVPLSQCEELSPAMVRYVVRSSNNLVLGDATVQGEFTKDPYVLRRRPRSVLCCPILRNKALVGALYLENDQAVEVFTPERVELLKLLAAQAAISIENARLFRDLQAALEQARESVRVKSEFLSKTTHELRTPLNAIINLPEMVKEKFTSLPVLRCTACDALFSREGEEDAHDCPSCQGRGTLQAEEHCHYEGDLQEVPEIQQIVVDSGRALLQIVNNIIELSDHEGMKSELRLSEFRVDMLIAKVSQLVQPLADKKEIRLSVPEVSAEATIRADWSKLRQALYNLLDNAIKFSPRRSEVVLRCDSTVEGICFSIQDQGIGISAADQQLIFESFRQIDEGSTRKFGGMGLGLAVTKSLVELHGGSVWVESEPGQGCTFHLKLPLSPRGPEETT